MVKRHGEKEDFFVHKYIHIDKTLHGNPTNVTFHYIEAGDPKNEKIVFTMGASEPAIVYTELMKRLVDEYHLIVIDGKGSVYSSLHPSSEIDPETTDPGSNWDPAFQGEEMVTALDAIGVKKFNLISSDLMSIVTSFWVPNWPDRVLRYIRAQSHVGVQSYSAVPQGRFFRGFPRTAEKLLSSTRVIIWKVITGGTGVSLLDKERRTSKSFTVPKELNEKVIKVLRSGNVVMWLYFWLSLPKPTVRIQIQLFKEVKCPVLLIQGIEDKAQPYLFFDGSQRFEYQRALQPGVDELEVQRVIAKTEEEKEKWRADKYFSSSPYAELVWIEDCGHFPHFEKPDEYAEHVRRFFSLTADLIPQ